MRCVKAKSYIVVCSKISKIVNTLAINEANK